MSSVAERPADDDEDAWEQLAEHRDALEICIEQDTPFKPDAKALLDELEQRGYT